MTDPQQERWQGEVRDEPANFPVASSTEQFDGAVWRIQTDLVKFPGQSVHRDILVHPGAVAIFAMNDDDQIFLIRQYRHPVAMYLFEAPAGLLDVQDEDPLDAAKRELREEAGIDATDWKVLLDFYTSPGGSTEAIRIYVARGLTLTPSGRELTGEAEETSLPGVWVDLDDAVTLILQSALGNPTTVAGALAAHAARTLDWRTLRPADSPWPARENLLHNQRTLALGE